jgi:hypothetical protein
LRLGLALAGLVLLRRVLALLLAVLLVLRLGLHLRFGEVERGEQAAGGAGEAVLAVGVAGHLGQRGVGLLAQGVAPQVEHAVRGLRRRWPVMRSRASKGQRRGQRQLVLAGHAVVALGLAGVGQAGAEVGGDAGHVAAAHRLHAHVLQRVEHLLGLAAGGQAGGVDRFRMVAEPQRRRVGRAAQLRHLGRRQGARRQRQAHALAGHAAGAGLEGHLHLGVGVRHRAQRAGGGALEFLLAGEVLHRGVASASLRPPARFRLRSSALRACGASSSGRPHGGAGGAGVTPPCAASCRSAAPR